MQKIFKLSFLILILLTLSQKALNASSNVYFVWDNTDIYLPINSSLDDYKDKYELNLYVNGKKDFSYTVYYETNNTFFTTVQTYKVGTYKVYYKAVSKKYNLVSEKLISFHVYDNIKPSISAPNDNFKVNYLEEFKILDHFIIKDNVTSFENLVIKDNLKEIPPHFLGKYEAFIEVTDEALNKETFNFTLEVIDEEKPVIKVLKPLVFNYLEEINLSEYLEVTDNYDGDLLKEIDPNLFNTSELGKSEVTLIVRDSSLNETSLNLSYEVINNLGPIINLKENVLKIDIETFNNLNLTFFKNLVLEVKLNYEEPYVLRIDLSNLIERIGTYEVFYEVETASGLIGSARLIIYLEEFKPPILEGEDQTLKLGESYDYLSFIKVIDPYDLNAFKNLEIIKNTVDILKEGDYLITYRCYNNSGKYAVKTLKIKVKKNPLEAHKKEFSKDNLKLSILLFLTILIYFGYAKFKKRKSSRDS